MLGIRTLGMFSRSATKLHCSTTLKQSQFVASKLAFYKTPLIKSNIWHQAFKRTYATHHQLSHQLRRQKFNRSYGSLVKPFLFTAGFSAGCYFLTPYLFTHTPMRYFKKNPMALVYGIIGLNAAVFGLWYARTSNMRLFKILNDYFLLDRSSTRKTQWSLLFSSFSHQEIFHLLINMSCLYSFAPTIIQALGVENFTSLYLISGVGSSFASIVFSYFTSSYGMSLGASGAISGIFASFSTLFPKAGVALFVIPIPGGAQMALLGFTVYNLAGCFLKWGSFDYAAHLGGTAIGVAYAYYVKWRVAQRQKRLRIW